MQTSLFHEPADVPAHPVRWRFEVTARDIRRFCQAIGQTEAPDAADGEGDTDLVAPPLFCQAMAYRDVPTGSLTADGSPIELRAGPPGARVMGGSSAFTLHRLVRAGETIEVCAEVMGVTRKSGRSGVLDLLEVRTLYTDAGGLPVATELATYVKRT